MTDRVYLAAHAPHEIPEDFVHRQPKQPRKPVVPKVPAGRHGSIPLRKDLERYMDKEGGFVDSGLYEREGGFTSAELSAILDPFYAKVHSYKKAMEAWGERNRLARIGQWPWYWADLVLKHQ